MYSQGINPGCDSSGQESNESLEGLDFGDVVTPPKKKRKSGPDESLESKDGGGDQGENGGGEEEEDDDYGSDYQPTDDEETEVDVSAWLSQEDKDTLKQFTPIASDSYGSSLGYISEDDDDFTLRLESEPTDAEEGKDSDQFDNGSHEGQEQCTSEHKMESDIHEDSIQLLEPSPVQNTPVRLSHESDIVCQDTPKTRRSGNSIEEVGCIPGDMGMDSSVEVLDTPLHLKILSTIGAGMSTPQDQIFSMDDAIDNGEKSDADSDVIFVGSGHTDSECDEDESLLEPGQVKVRSQCQKCHANC